VPSKTSRSNFALVCARTCFATLLTSPFLVHTRVIYPATLTPPKSLSYATPAATDLQFKSAATLLFDTKGHTSSSSSTYERSPQFCVGFDRNYDGAVGWKGVFEASTFISFQHLRVAIAPC
jgi:hypothetical protein